MVDTPSSASRRRYASLRAHAPAVVPSLLLCDFGHLADEVRRLEDAGVAALHLDVMDGNFVPNLTYGLPLVEAVRRCTKLPIETHLMITNPAEYLERYHAAGADALTFHYEAVNDPRPLLEKIRSLGAEAGLAVNPGTPVSAIADCLDFCDLVLVMSVSPGFGGQKFESVALDKLRELRSIGRPELILEVDGGVNDGTIAAVSAAGAQSLIVGSAIFNHSDYGAAIARLSAAARQTPAP